MVTLSGVKKVTEVIKTPVTDPCPDGWVLTDSTDQVMTFVRILL